MKQRIKPIDGLRAFAAFGVVWIHAWMFCGNPTFNFLSVDIFKLIAVVGNGVDFFFVISGFCMYLMIDKGALTVKNYLNFLYKRFLRIAPAFFTSVFVYAILLKINELEFLFWYNVIIHLLFLNNIFSDTLISGPFWSIGTEWHFYIILPVVILLCNRISLIKAVVTLSALSLIFFCFVNLGYFDISWWGNQIVVRFPEFGCGIIAAFLFLNNKKIPIFLSGTLGLLLAFGVLYLGRLMMFTPLLIRAGNFAFLLKTLSYTVMTAGFAFILYHVITLPSMLSKLLSNKILGYLGKISYSIYLWHSLAFIILWKFLYQENSSAPYVVVVFVIISFLSVILASISYKYLESFYFKRNDFSHENKVPELVSANTLLVSIKK
jgi:peptidoglycan/LPS O-acetylase OafA/YrhL